MREIRVGAAQFEVRDADKAYNLGVIETLARQAAAQINSYLSARKKAKTA